MKLYVPDPQKWVDYFEKKHSGKTSLHQTSAGRRGSIIPIEESKISRERKQVSIRAVLPSEETAARAKSELIREGIKPKTVSDAFQSKKGERKRRLSKGPQTVPFKKAKTKKDIFEIE